MNSHDSRGWALRITSYLVEVIMKLGAGNTAFQSTVALVAPVLSQESLDGILLSDFTLLCF